MIIYVRFVYGKIIIRFIYIFVLLIFKVLNNFINSIEKFIRFNIIYIYIFRLSRLLLPRLLIL